jgi:hypothetical protein
VKSGKTGRTLAHVGKHTTLIGLRDISPEHVEGKGTEILLLLLLRDVYSEGAVRKEGRAS